MRTCITLVVALSLAACDLSHEPEVRSQPNQLAQIGQWSATINPVGTGTVRGSLTVREFGSYAEAEVSLTGGLPTRAYQWRIFRGSCAATAAAELGLHAAIQSYPDLVTNASGAASATPLLGGALNSPAGVYSIRVRLGQSTTNWNGTSPIACGDLRRS